MVLQLKQLFDIVGEQTEFDYNIPIEDLKPYKSYTFVSPIAVKGTVKNRTGIVTLDFSVKFTIKLDCDRCLSEFNREFSYGFKHYLARSLNTDSDDYTVCPENKLDLDELAISNILLQLPSKILCKEDCKGLCHICGNNNNISSCSCLKE